MLLRAKSFAKLHTSPPNAIAAHTISASDAAITPRLTIAPSTLMPCFVRITSTVMSPFIPFFRATSISRAAGSAPFGTVESTLAALLSPIPLIISSRQIISISPQRSRFLSDTNGHTAKVSVSTPRNFAAPTVTVLFSALPLSTSAISSASTVSITPSLSRVSFPERKRYTATPPTVYVTAVRRSMQSTATSARSCFPECSNIFVFKIPFAASKYSIYPRLKSAPTKSRSTSIGIYAASSPHISLAEESETA